MTNEEEKSLELSKLMGWECSEMHKLFYIESDDEFTDCILCPYEGCYNGLAQFAAILLKFPEVFEYAEGGGYLKPTEHGGCDIAPTQENILDEILKINGVKL